MQTGKVLGRRLLMVIESEAECRKIHPRESRREEKKRKTWRAYWYSHEIGPDALKVQTDRMEFIYPVPWYQ